MFSKKYVASTQIFFIYLLVLPMRITTFGSVLSAINQNKIILKWSIIGFLMNVIISLILIEYVGIIGPAIGTVFSIYLVGLGQLIVISKLIKLNIKKIFPFRYILKLIVLSFILVFIIKLIPLETESSIIQLLFSGGVFILIYFALRNYLDNK
jgi:O-antigen/teichoic acid export membrane protein